MNSKTRRFIAIVGISLGLLLPLNRAAADSASVKQLSAQWWQWALSIPADVNPQTDATGEDCMVGQRGEVWFLAGTFGGSATRTCVVPEGKTLFFPVINSVNIDAPNVCGQGPDRIPVKDLRAFSAAFIDGAADLAVEIDGQPIGNLHRIQSQVFEIALPEDNVLNAFCPPPGVPAGIYSPAVDDGYYVRLNPLAVGNHTLHFHAENPDAAFVLDVAYDLTVVPVIQK
jgi:hypothetical protein